VTGRWLVLLYPPSWRARYGEEFRALLDDTGAGLRQIADVVPAAAAAWIRPPRHLHDREARLRTTVTVVLNAWSVMAAGAVLFAKTARDGAWHAPGPAAGYYTAYVVACCAAVLVLAAGTAPLACAILATARRDGQLHRALLLLSTPLTAPLAFLAAAAGVSAVAASPSGVGPHWFLALAALGTATSLTCAAGPATALTRTCPRGTSLPLAAITAATSTALLATATAAATLSQLTQPPTHALPLTTYATTMTVPFAIAATSSLRTLRRHRATSPER
jgi:hypothetical protein